MHFCYIMYMAAHYLNNVFDEVNENQTSSPPAVASLIIFFFGQDIRLVMSISGFPGFSLFWGEAVNRQYLQQQS